MKIIKNNYTPKPTEVKHVGYRQTCSHCNSIVLVELNDVWYDDYYKSKAYTCPCCGTIQCFNKSKNTEEWMETILK